uniref:hypothetical protein n=1 Tax=Arthrobacter sp. TaxID=1667 RepID=UPI00159EF367|nr:hypothetical protein [Arthrobacter sp.]
MDDGVRKHQTTENRMKNLKITAALSLGTALLLSGCSNTPDAAPEKETATTASATSQTPKASTPLDLCIEEMQKPHYEADPGLDKDYSTFVCNEYQIMYDADLITEEDFSAAGYAGGATQSNIDQLMHTGGFTFSTEAGTEGSFTLPGKTDTKSEELRKLAKAPEVTYVQVTVDNRQATETANMYAIQLFDVDGKKYELKNITDFYDEWRDSVDIENDDSNAATDLYNRYVDANNEATTFTEIGEKNTYVMAYEGKLPEFFTIVEVYPSGGFDSVSAEPEGFVPVAPMD